MKMYVLSLVAAGFCLTSYGQNVGIGTNTPHTSAILDVKSNSKGILIPQLTAAQKNVIPVPVNCQVVLDVTIRSQTGIASVPEL